MKATRFALLIAALSALPAARAHAASPVTSLTCPTSPLLPGTVIVCTMGVTPAAALTVVNVASGSPFLSVSPTVTVPPNTDTWPFTAVAGDPDRTEIGVSVVAGPLKSQDLMIMALGAPMTVNCGTAALVANETRSCTVTFSSATRTGDDPQLRIGAGGPVSASVTEVQVPVGTTSATFDLHVDSNAASGTVQISARTARAQVSTVVKIAGTIRPDAITCDRPSLQSGDTTTCKVALSASSPDALIVKLDSSNPALGVSATAIATDGSAEFTATAGAISASGDAIITATLGAETRTVTIPLAMPGTLTAMHCDATTLRPGATALCTLTAKEAALADFDVAITSSSQNLTVPEKVAIRKGHTASDQFVVTAIAAASSPVTLTAAYDGKTFDQAFTISAGGGSFPGGGGSGSGGGYRPEPGDGSVGGCSGGGASDALVPALMMGVLALLSWRRRARR